MKSKKQLQERFERARLYAVTDLKRWSAEEYHRIESALRGGVDILQLRSKMLSKKMLEQIGKELRPLTDRFGALLIVNDFPDIAGAIQADGVHLGQADMSVREARRMLGGEPFLIGKSTHRIEEAVTAEIDDADYIGMGPIYSTPTKPDYVCVGLDYIHRVQCRVMLPAVAIGGITLERVPEILKNGARRIAVVRAVFDTEDPEQAAKRFKDAIVRHETAHAEV